MGTPCLCKTNLSFFQIGSLENYYHFHHSKTFKRSTLSSRGPHSFLRMDPKVWSCTPKPHSCGLQHCTMTALSLRRSPVHAYSDSLGMGMFIGDEKHLK